MRVEIRAGTAGVACWNEEAIQAYAKQINEKEERLRGRNPDLTVIPGRVKCYGCELQEYHYAMKCTAELTKTLFAVDDEIKPRAADAVGLHREIPGLATTRPAELGETPGRGSSDESEEQPTPANNYLGADHSATTPPRPSGLRGLLRRGS